MKEKLIESYGEYTPHSGKHIEAWTAKSLAGVDVARDLTQPEPKTPGRPRFAQPFGSREA
jgi:hypothetical protein